MGISVKEEIKSVEQAHNSGEGQLDVDGIEEQKFTVSKLKAFLPKGSKVQVTQQTVDTVNGLIDSSQVHRGLMEEKLLSHMHLMGPGVGIKQIIKAIQFTTLSLTPGLSQSKAYMITFPDKAQELIDSGGNISSFASMYAQTKTPSTIAANYQVGPSVTYAPLTHQLVDKLMQLVNGKGAGPDDYVSPTVQLNSTLGLLDYIKPPEEQTINITANAGEATIEAQNNLAEQLQAMAEIQRARLVAGQDISKVQQIDIKYDVAIDAEVS